MLKRGVIPDVYRFRRERSGNLTDKYFEKELDRIREIRAGERRFYQKITDLYATAIVCDKTALAPRRFYASVQKMHYAVHGKTATELIVECADSRRQNMGQGTWPDSPDGENRSLGRFRREELFKRIRDAGTLAEKDGGFGDAIGCF